MCLMRTSRRDRASTLPLRLPLSRRLHVPLVLRLHAANQDRQAAPEAGHMTTVVYETKRALYFGFGRGGHFLWVQPDRSIDPSAVPGFPWGYDLLDTQLLKNRKVQDEPTGTVHWVHGGLPLWIGFFWWDRSGDKRPASNSGFYVQGFSHLELQPALDFACKQWPHVIARQLYPLRLQHEIGAHLG